MKYVIMTTQSEYRTLIEVKPQETKTIIYVPVVE